MLDISICFYFQKACYQLFEHLAFYAKQNPRNSVCLESSASTRTYCMKGSI